MKQALKAILLLFTVYLVAINGQAQVYPVSGNGVLIPPYSVYLADYTAGTSDRLVLNLVLNDVTRPELRVRLRTKIIGQNITLETRPEYIGKEFVLQGGIPLRITGSELTEYFSPANLNFSGITKREFEKTGALPAGFYQFCFEVLEYNRGVKISNSICANGWLILNDPPLINLPRNGEKLVPTQPQNVVFQWTPRHTGSPNSAFSTEYDIKLVELWPANRNPNDAILTSPPILEVTTRSTTLIYDVSQTPLEAGRHYALQIKAKSIVGAEELDLFKNNGKSEVITFIYGDPCTVPQSIFAESNSATRFTVKWTGALNHTGYSLKYRLADSPTAEWYTSTTLTPDAGISGLLSGTTYEYQVAGSCGNFESEYSGVARIKTLSAGEQGYTCGMPLEQFNLDPANLIDVLKVGEVIQAGDFDVKVAKVSGSSGTFSGEGVIEVPFFNKAKIKAEFSSIVVNKDMRMVSGYMNVTGAGVEVVPSGFTNLIDQLSETLSALDTALTNIENNLPKPFDEFAFVADTMLTLPGPVIVSQETDGSVVITDANGNEHRLPQGTEATVVDDQGNGTLIDANGKAHNVSGAVATAAGNREYNLMLRFAESQSNHLYGFDAITSGAPDGLKKLYDKLEDDYYVPFKAIETGKTDLVSAILEGTAIDKSKLRFERGGVPVTAPPFSGSNTTVTVSANMGGEQEALIAVLPADGEGAKDQVLGRVNVATYNQIQKVVHIVPVNGNDYKFGGAGSLQNELNKIYSQAVVSWSVQIENGIQVEGINPFNVGETGLLTNYTDHMKKVISAYKSAAGMQNDENNFYLFLVNAPSDPKITGYMPRSKQSGFIFSDQHNSESAIARTMAHELGHGAFNLHHTFMEENFSLPKNSTDNLMDYAEGTKLYKYQWDMIRYPAVVMGVFEGDEEAKYSDGEYFAKLLQQIRCAYALGQDQIQLPVKYRGSSGFALFDYGLPTPQAEINGLKLRSATWTAESNKEVITGIQRPTIDKSRGLIKLGNFSIVVSAAIYNINTGPSPVDHFIQYLFPKPEDVVSNFNKVWDNGLRNKVENNQSLSEEDIDRLKTIASCETRYLNTDSRYKIVKGILSYSTWEYYEDLILDIIQSTPPGSQSKDLFDRINRDASLLDKLIVGMDNYGGEERNFDRLATEFLALFYRGYTNEDLQKEYARLEEDHKVYFYGFGNYCEWSISATRDFDRVDFKEVEIYNYEVGNFIPYQDGSSLPSCDSNEKNYSYRLSDFVAVEFTTSSFLSNAGDIKLFPVFIYYILVKSHWNEKYFQAAQAGWFLLGIVTPVDEFYLLGKALQYGSKGFRALRLSVARVLAKETKIELALTPNVQELRTLSANKLDDYIIWGKPTAEDLQDELWSDLARVGDAGDVASSTANINVDLALKEAYVSGFTKEKILSYAKTDRPLPSTYLKPLYIQKHLEQFKDGVSFICPKKIIDDFDPIGRMDGVFVVPKRVMDDLMRKTGGDINLIEFELAIPKGRWSSKKMCRVDVDNPHEFNLRMPSGKEEGANEYFKPGGFTAAGVPEAVIDQIPKGKYISKLIN